MLESFSNVLSLIARVKQAADKFRDADMNNIIADLSEAGSKLRLQVVTLEAENARLKGETPPGIVKRGEAYYREPAISGQACGPFCTHCWEVESKMVSLHREMLPDFGTHSCPGCKEMFTP